MAGSEREVAVDVLIEVLENGAYNNIALRDAFARVELDSRQKAFVTEVVNGVLRNCGLIDYMINQTASLPVDKMRPVVRNAIRSAVYQLSFLASAKNFAVCNETVQFVKNRNMPQLAAFVNGVLRNFTRGLQFELPNEAEKPAEFLSVKYSLPLWLSQMWLEDFGFEKAKAICETVNTPPPVTACVNALKTDKAKLAQNLRDVGVIVKDGALSENALLLQKTDDLTKLRPFADGQFHIMDESAMKVVELLNPLPGEKILDMCAAPGGKAFYCAELMGNKGEITALDIHDHKTKLINDGAWRLKLGIVKTLTKDAAISETKFNEAFDKVLLDAPCSGYGAMRKKPDIRFKKEKEDGEKLVELQRSLLARAAEYVKKGGALVYSTCTMTKEENGGNADWFKENFAFDEEERKLILPCDYGTDGFFMAKFVKL